jgi:hypothetical protein
MIADACVLGAAFWGSFLLRFEGSIPDAYFEVMVLFLPFVVAAKWLIVVGVGWERGRY